MLEWKADWAEARDRMLAFWRGETLDRPPLWLTAPRTHPANDDDCPRPPAEVAERYLDKKYVLAKALHRLSHTCFIGESVPAAMPYLGAGEMALYLGSQPTFAEDTVWYHPCLPSLSGSADLRHDPANPWWRWTQEMTSMLAEAGRGRFLVSYPDLVEGLDILASLRGTEGLLMDLLDAPEEAHRYLRQILQLYFTYYDRLSALMCAPQTGSVFSGFGVWMPGRGAKLQCDFSAMISPGMFEAFVVPYLRRQCQALDHSLYHLDGPGALQHLRLLLGIPELGGIQWEPGAGHEPLHDARWLPLYHQIQDAGKIVFLMGVEPEAIVPLCRQLDRAQVSFSAVAESEEQAYAVLRAVERVHASA